MAAQPHVHFVSTEAILVILTQHKTVPINHIDNIERDREIERGREIEGEREEREIER